MLQLSISQLRFSSSLALFLTVALTSIPVTAVPLDTQTPKHQTPNTSEEKTLQTLLRRWLGISFIQLIPEKLPEKLPVQLPLPQKAQIVGSIILSSNIFQIILDTPGESPETIQAFYRQHLLNAGWQMHEKELNATEKRGFLDAAALESPTDKSIEYCLPLNKAKLNIEASYRFISSTEVEPQVMLYLQTFDSIGAYNNQCLGNQLPSNQSPSNKPLLLLPPLVSPSNAGVSGVSTIATDQTAYSYTLLNTKLDIQALADHYATQVEKAGWKRLNREITQQGIWNTWTLKDQQGQLRQGLLSINALAGAPNEYIVYFSMK
jgi:hypothetical protein